MQGRLFLRCALFLFLFPQMIHADGAEYSECEFQAGIPFEQSFSEAYFPPVDWTIESTNPDFTWMWIDEPMEDGFPRDHFAYVQGQKSIPADERLRTERIDAMHALGCDELRVDRALIRFRLAVSSLSPNWNFAVSVCDAPYQATPCDDEEEIWNFQAAASEMTTPPQINQWHTFSVAIPENHTYGELRFAFRFYGQEDVEVGLDDILIYVNGDCCKWIEGSGGGYWTSDDDDDDRGQSCGISVNQSSAMLASLMLVIGFLAMAAGLSKKEGR